MSIYFDEKKLKQCDAVLVQMPYTWLNPSLALGLLKTDLSEAGVSNEIVYASHHFVDAVGYDLFTTAENLFEPYHSAWEMLFAPFTDFTPQKSAEEVLRILSESVDVMYTKDHKKYPPGEVYDMVMQIWPTLSQRTADFLDEEADAIMKRGPKIVGCSVLTQQRNASFALFKRIKERDPDIVTIMGGSCCAGEVGDAYVSRIPSLDYVFTGEGDRALGVGCRMILEDRTDELKKIHPEFHTPHAPIVNKRLEDMNDSPIPDYTEYFEQVKRDSFVQNDQAVILMESSRGCWWGQKGKCRFCGLHLSKESICYRPKSDDRVWDEAKELSARYGKRDLLFADCILDLGFIRRLPEEAPDDRKHLRIIAECKSNMKERDMRLLKRNGFVSLQPGIESLSDGMLKLMNKGAQTIDQLACLKYARMYGMRMFWNLLYGFPGEEVPWYDEMIELMSHIHHLQPPTGFSYMMLVRNSVFYDDHDEYGIHTILPRENELATDPDTDFSMKTSNYFITPDIVRHTDQYERIRVARESWQADFHSGKSLRMSESEEKAVIRDTRYAFKRVFTLEGIRRQLLLMTRETASEKKVLEALREQYEESEIEDALSFVERNHLSV